MTYGLSVSAPPWAALVISNTAYGGILPGLSEEPLCTGSVIADSWVLTAAHCVTNKAGGTVLPSSIRVLIGRDSRNSKSQGAAYGVQRIVRMPGFQSLVRNDAALIELQNFDSQRWHAMPLAFESSVINANEGVTLYGYGDTGWDVLGQQAVAGVLKKSPNSAFWRTPKCDWQMICFSREGRPRVMEGDSGGPWLRWHAGAWQLIGVQDTVGGLARSDPGDPARATSPFAQTPSEQSMLNWIRMIAAIPNYAVGTIIRNPRTGASWLVGSDHYRRWIATGATFVCLTSQGHRVINAEQITIDTVPDRVGVRASCASSVPPPSALASGTGRIIIKPCLNLRANATGSSTLLGCIPYNRTITITCSKTGSSVTGPYGTTRVWDHTSYAGKAGFVTDAYVYTGTSRAVAKPCGSTSPTPAGHFDSLTSPSPGKVQTAGWAADPNAPKSPIKVRFYTDGKAVATVLASRGRPDVARVYPAYGPNHGFVTTLSLAAGRHSVCVYALNVGSGSDHKLGCKTVAVASPQPQSPVAPTGVTAALTGRNSFKLSWKAVGGVNSYVVYLDGSKLGMVKGTSFDYGSVKCGTTHTPGVQSLAANGEVSAVVKTTISVQPCAGEDTTPPSAPSSPHVNGSPTHNSAFLDWGASTDNVGVVGYNLYLDSNRIGSSSVQGYMFSGLACGTAYTLGVSAYDAAGNESATASTDLTTRGCSLTCPSVISSSASNITASAVDITYNWSAGNTSGVQADVVIVGSGLNPVSVGPGETTVHFSGLQPNKSYQAFLLVQTHECPLFQDTSVHFTTAAAASASVCPSVTSASASNITSTSVTINYNWSAGTTTDAQAVLNIYSPANVNPVQIPPGSSSTAFSGLTPSTSYNAFLLIGATGCPMVQDTSVHFTTAAAASASVCPSVTSASASNITSTSVTINYNWSAGTTTDAQAVLNIYSPANVNPVQIPPGSSSTAFSGLTPSTSYNAFLLIGATGCPMVQDTSVHFTTAAAASASVCPSVTSASASNITSTSVTINYNWSAGTTTDAQAVLNIYSPANVNPVQIPPGSSSTAFSGLTPSTSYNAFLLIGATGCPMVQDTSVHFTTAP